MYSPTELRARRVARINVNRKPRSAPVRVLTNSQLLARKLPHLDPAATRQRLRREVGHKTQQS